MSYKLQQKDIAATEDCLDRGPTVPRGCKPASKHKNTCAQHKTVSIQQVTQTRLRIRNYVPTAVSPQLRNVDLNCIHFVRGWRNSL
jgi:hypothetical protein